MGWYRVDAEVTVVGEWWVEADSEEDARDAFDGQEEPENERSRHHGIIAVVETDKCGNPVTKSGDSQ